MENLMDLTGRNIVVTGAAQGIGEAVARMAHGLGAKVVLIDVLGEKLETLAADLGEGRAEAHVGSVTDPAFVQSTIDTAVASNGDLMAFRAAELYDAGEECGKEANAAKYLAGEATFKACTNAVMTHGGMGYAKEFHVERYLREALIHRIAPISPQLILCYLAEKALGLPKSY